MEIAFQVTGSLYGLADFLCIGDLRKPEFLGNHEFTYTGPFDGLAGAYMAWCRQPIGTSQHRVLHSPTIRATVEDKTVEGIVRNWMHGAFNWSAFDFETLRQALDTPNGDWHGDVRLWRV